MIFVLSIGWVTLFDSESIAQLSPGAYEGVFNLGII